MLKSIFTNRASATSPQSADSTLLPEALFLRTVMLERKRTERSGRPFVLMILDAGELLQKATNGGVLARVFSVLQSVRDTDVKGWYKDGAALGVVFTELGGVVDKAAVRTLATRVMDALYGCLSIQEINDIQLSFHVYPEDWDEGGSRSDPKTSTLRFALSQEVAKTKKAALHLKRLIDIVGSLAALVFFLPLMLAIAIVIKMTSRGPVLFRQARVGQHGTKFTFLKFRSMYVNTNSAIHEAYVKSFIAGKADAHSNGEAKIFKLTADPRITPIGRFIRKTSLDELPQFVNVLKGEMSLVGPRPPVPYEVDGYSLWHRRRLLAVKPGITGLWQVEGRSRVTFDEMVRLDIRYARSWSLWLDLKILAQTPNAVIKGSGAC